MRFTINRDAFLKGLNIAGKAIGSKSPIPVMMNFKLHLTLEGLSITGSNNELTIKTIIPVQDGEERIITDIEYGATLVSNKILTDIVRKIEGEKINFEVIDETIVKISDNRSNFKLNAIRVEEYPEIDLSNNGISLTIKKDVFQTMISQTAFAASNKEQRPILTAVNLQADNNRLVATATDSARLARKEIVLEESYEFTANVPAKVLSEVSKLIEGENVETISFAVSDTKVLVLFGNTIVSSRLIGGDYPNTRNIVPKSFNYFLEANAQELISAMERVSLLLSEKENVVKLTLSKDGVEVSTKSSQVGSATEKINTCQYDGERLEISFNSNYVIEAIKACGSEDVTLAFLGEMKPFVIKNAQDGSQIQLVTPMRTYN
jgi:DNA polymerase-3 subunit beta